MIKTCGKDYNYDEKGYPPSQYACGKTFDDADCMTLCPHPRLDDPTWRKQIDTYLISKGFVWSEIERRYTRFPE